jgi:hypothetical protein
MTSGRISARRNLTPQLLVLCLLLASVVTSGAAQADQASSASSPKSAAPASKTGLEKTGPASASEIAAAKASGKVWVNTESHIYHKGGRWYGKTKTGKFMTESEAKAAGYKEAHRE